MNIFKSIGNFFSKMAQLAGKPVWNAYNVFGIGRVFAKREYYYGVVYSCIDAIAQSVSSTRFGLFSTDKKGNKTEIQTHPALDLLKHPNPFMTGHDLMYLISSHIDAFGKAFVYPVPFANANNGFGEIWALQPDRMRTILGPNFISGYVYYNPQGQTIPFDADEIIEIKRPHPFQQQEGVSTIEMARFAVESDFGAQQWNNNFFNNGALPSGMLETDSEIGEDAFQRLKKEFHSLYEGKENAHKVMLLEQGIHFKQVTVNQKDMDFLLQRKFNRDEILSIFKVPKPILAIADDVNRANAETSEYVFAKRTVDPRLSLIFEKLNEFYLTQWQNTNGLMLEYDNPVPADEAAEKDYFVAAVDKWLTKNEVRSEKGLDPVEGGDELYIPTLSVAVGQEIIEPEPEDTIPPEDDEPDEDENNEENEPKGIRAVRKIKMAKFFPKSWLKRSVGDRKYLTRKKRYINAQVSKDASKYEQQFKILVRDIKAKPVKGLRYKGAIVKKGIEDILKQIMPDLSGWKGLFGTIVFSQNQDTLQESFTNASNSYNVNPFSIGSETAVKYLKARSQATADGEVETIYDKARGVIAQNLANDVTDLPTIQSEVADTLSEETQWRSDMIARTELQDAYQSGAVMDWQASGAVDQLEWIGNDPQDEECAGNIGEVVGIGEAFPSGDSEPPIHPNCECDVVPYFG